MFFHTHFNTPLMFLYLFFHFNHVSYSEFSNSHYCKKKFFTSVKLCIQHQLLIVVVEDIIKSLHFLQQFNKQPIFEKISF